MVREDVKACLKTFGEQAIAIWKNGERIGYLALCGGNQVVEAEVLEEQDFVPALAAYLKENALDSLSFPFRCMRPEKQQRYRKSARVSQKSAAVPRCTAFLSLRTLSRQC